MKTPENWILDTISFHVAFLMRLKEHLSSGTLDHYWFQQTSSQIKVYRYNFLFLKENSKILH